MNILRIVLALLAILLLLATLPSFDPNAVQFAVLPFICFLFAFDCVFRSAAPQHDLVELTTAPGLLTSRAPPLS